MTMIEYYTL